MQQEMKERGREMEKQAKEGYEKVVGTVERRAVSLSSTSIAVHFDPRQLFISLLGGPKE
jgi:hypothetical protein